jgi:hypothetical protein
MNAKEGFIPRSPGSDLGAFLALVTARLKGLRRERDLVEKAIVALTEISRARQSRYRRAMRY